MPAPAEPKRLRSLTFFVEGQPIPKGSMRAFAFPLKNPRPGSKQTHRAVVTHDDRRTKPWGKEVRNAALKAKADLGWGALMPFVAVPVRLEVTFYVLRLGSHYRKDGTLKPSAPKHPAVKPDGDKLERAVRDGLEAVIYDNDSRVTSWVGKKRYGARPGVLVSITEDTEA